MGTSTITSMTFTTTTTTLTTTTFTITTSTTTMTTGTSTTTTYPPGGFVGEDPVSFHNNILQHFWLPEGQPVSLLRTPEFHLLGVAMAKGKEQYITRIIIESPIGEPVLQVSIRDDIWNASRAVMQGSGFFQTVRVNMDYLGLTLTKMPSLSDYAYRWQTIAFAFSVVPRLKVGKAQAEMMWSMVCPQGLSSCLRCHRRLNVRQRWRLSLHTWISSFSCMDTTHVKAFCPSCGVFGPFLKVRPPSWNHPTDHSLVGWWHLRLRRRYHHG